MLKPLYYVHTLKLLKDEGQKSSATFHVTVSTSSFKQLICTPFLDPVVWSFMLSQDSIWHKECSSS